MVEKHIAKRDVTEKNITNDDLEDIIESGGTRKLFFKEELDTRDRSERVKDQFIEAGQDTRNANQFVKLVNAQLQKKVSQIAKIKEAQRKYEEEMNMFKVDAVVEQSGFQAKSNEVSNDVEAALITREPSAMINKYGFEKLTKALDAIMAAK
ncbi:hypothetical protein QVH35_08845 [Candidatus Nitrosotenuis chungbukensis]|uniref:hypothetical protein n=1 Tax=Candidatus Nitrosotenuis chungbukensis TaxID=1353246 RepID=UPI00267384FD|nr:hypothetical protein [Candidatus Nitrosotenuis chungbukensis]WKT57478.1 hypothetical protein QVH35_08845 [Candidatus Nitrosotenuis chungbukensis]